MHTPINLIYEDISSSATYSLKFTFSTGGTISIEAPNGVRLIVHRLNAEELERVLQFVPVKYRKMAVKDILRIVGELSFDY